MWRRWWMTMRPWPPVCWSGFGTPSTNWMTATFQTPWTESRRSFLNSKPTSLRKNHQSKDSSNSENALWCSHMFTLCSYQYLIVGKIWWSKIFNWLLCTVHHITGTIFRENLWNWKFLYSSIRIVNNTGISIGDMYNKFWFLSAMCIDGWNFHTGTEKGET